MSDPSSIWTRYWQFDRIASCFDGAGASNYDEALAGSWIEFFSQLPPESNVLDVCTGNGAIAIIASEVSQSSGKLFRIKGIDQADIDPKRFVTRHAEALNAVEFLGNCSAEHLPFPSSSLDAVVSQYGIEYTDLNKSLGEVLRTLAPGGRFRFVMHAAEGSVRRGAEVVSGEADALAQIGLVDAAVRCFEAVCTVEREPSRSATAIEQADAAIASFKDALRAAAELLKTATDKAMVHNSASVLEDAFNKRRYFPVQTLISKAEEVRSEILSHQGRLLALIEAAVSRDEVDQLQERLRTDGATEVWASEIQRDGELIAYALAGQRSHPSQ